VESSKLQCLFKSWGHSREEDTGGLTVYRPAGFNFPLSRGRDRMEFQPDGTILQVGPGPDDRSRDVIGSWKSAGDNVFEVRMAGAGPQARRMTVIDCDDHVLKVRWD
jgi:hypothetical protein